MINIRRNILTPLAFLLLGLTVSSCSSEEFKDQINQTGSPTLGISIGVSGPTRSATGGDFEPGSGFENYLDIENNNYRIYFFNSENKYIATFNPYLKSSVSQTPSTVDGVDTYYYSFEGEVPEGVGIKFKLVMFANWDKYPVENGDGLFVLKRGETTLKDLVTHADAQFSRLTSPGDGEWLGKDRLIPFYGVREYDLSTFEDIKGYIKDGKLIGNVYVNLESDELALPLLRAMAKVEVVLTNPFASFSNVEMTKVNDKGYNSPFKEVDDWKFDYTDYFHKYVWDKEFFRGVHLVGGNNSSNTERLSFKKVTSRSVNEDGTIIPEKWVAYVPEYQNIGVGGDFTTIEVTLANPGVDDAAWDNPQNVIYFAKDGTMENNPDGEVGVTKRYNIERNNIYRFTLDVMTTGIKCQVDIQPFAECRLEMEFGLMRDERGDLKVLQNADGTLPKYFEDFMKTYPGKWPVMENGKGLTPLDDDYYAIVLGQDGLMSNAEVWLKDKDGCRILSNFSEEDVNSKECSTRHVIHFFGQSETPYLKDKDGERRLYHYPNHCTVALDNEGRMIYKNDKNDENPFRHLVESFDEKTGICWIIANVKEENGKIITTFKKVDGNGELTEETETEEVEA